MITIRYFCHLTKTSVGFIFFIQPQRTNMEADFKTVHRINRQLVHGMNINHVVIDSPVAFTRGRAVSGNCQNLE